MILLGLLLVALGLGAWLLYVRRASECRRLADGSVLQRSMHAVTSENGVTVLSGPIPWIGAGLAWVSNPKGYLEQAQLKVRPLVVRAPPVCR